MQAAVETAKGDTWFGGHNLDESEAKWIPETSFRPARTGF